MPAGLADGTYKAYHDDKGNEVHVLLNSTLSSPAALEAGRPAPTKTFVGAKYPRTTPAWKSYQTYCGCGFNMDHGNCDAAVEDLKQQFDRAKDNEGVALVEAQTSWYSIRGNAVAFVCQGNLGTGWTRDQFTNDALAITQNCGWYVAGTVDGKFSDAGYMIYNPGLDFCGHATSSSQFFCH
ncbi:hypothetical protein K461DRAFT_296413 [Myriangium duriaei CBS 260.36]|uniref:Uncharacterized protein n=1 Tax=Myriangium duriaei CBS 260.36 TaxID=1168546 RepID=A0A9P4J063_9PEZI|nr:hypothetical protein K461DRAFT_296413 [Myriangium duriaei CBS 260.36]